MLPIATVPILCGRTLEVFTGPVDSKQVSPDYSCNKSELFSGLLGWITSYLNTIFGQTRKWT